MQTIDYYWIELLMLNQNTWNYLTVCKLFVLRIVTWSYDCSLRIIIIIIITVYTVYIDRIIIAYVIN